MQVNCGIFVILNQITLQCIAIVIVAITFIGEVAFVATIGDITNIALN